MISNIGTDDLVRRLVSSGLSALVVKLLTAVLSYAMFLVLAKAMSEAEFGRFAFGFSLAIVLASLASLGLTTAVLRYWPQYRATGRPDLARGFLLGAGWATVAASVLVGAALAMAALILADVDPASGEGYLAAAALLVPGIAIAEYLASALRAEGEVARALAPRDVVWRALICAAAVFAIWRGFEFTAASALLLSGVLLFVIIAIQGLHARRVFAPEIAGIPPVTDVHDWRATALPMWGAALLFTLVQQFDVVIVGLVMTPEQTGPYFAALRTASLLGLMLIAANMVAAPLFSRLYHSGDRAGLQRLCALLSLGIALPTLAGLAVLVLGGPWLLGLFDPAYAAAQPVLLVLSLGFTAAALAGPNAYLLQMSGGESAYLRIMALCYLATLAAQCIFTPIYGLMGAAVPNALGLVASSVWAVLHLRSRIGVDPSIASIPGLTRARSEAELAARQVTR